MAIDYLKNRCSMQPGTAVIYIYCDYKQRHLQTPVHLLGSIWRQLSQHQSELPNSIQEKYDKYRQNRANLPPEEAESIACEAMQHQSIVYLVVDAIDELTEKDGTPTKFLNALQKLLVITSSREGKLQLMVTSRLEENPFEDAVKLEVYGTRDDLIKLVQERVMDGVSSSKGISEKVRSDADIIKSLIDGVTSRAHQM